MRRSKLLFISSTEGLLTCGLVDQACERQQGWCQQITQGEGTSTFPRGLLHNNICAAVRQLQRQYQGGMRASSDDGERS